MQNRIIPTYNSLTLQEKKLLNVFISEYNDTFQSILITPPKQFIENIIERVGLTLKKNFDHISQKSKIRVEDYLTEKIYLKDLKLASNAMKIIKKKKEENLDIKYIFNGKIIEHCSKDKKNGYYIHSCGEKFYSFKYKPLVNFINLEEEPKNIYDVFLICIKCDMIYKSNLIKFYCEDSNYEFYSRILNDDDKNKDLPYATWKKYHCNLVINDTMKCPNCKQSLLYDKENNLLICRKCNNKMNPDKIVWKCIICKSDFKSEIKEYNNLEFKNMKICINDTLINKIKAYPEILGCDCKINFDKIKFYHNQNCKGDLYLGKMNNKKIVVCNKCEAMCFYENFNWTCPLCNKRFKIKNLIKNNINRSLSQNKVKNEDNKGRKSLVISPCRKRKNDNNSESLSPGRNSKFSHNRKSQVDTPFINLKKLLNNDDNDKNKNSYNESEDIQIKEEAENDEYSDNEKNNKEEEEIEEEEIENNNNNKLLNNKKENEKINNNNKLLNKKEENEKINNKLLNKNEEEEEEEEEKKSEDNKNNNNKLINKEDIKNKKNKDNDDNYEDNKNNKKLINKNSESTTNASNNNSLKLEKNNNTENDNIENDNENIKKKENKIINSKEEEEDKKEEEEEKKEEEEEEKKEKEEKKEEEEEENKKYNITDYKIKEQIGEGSFGKIFKVEAPDKKLYALKKIIITNKYDYNNLQHEYNILENILKSGKKLDLVKIYQKETKQIDSTTYILYVVMDLATCDWEEEIEKRKKNKLHYKEKELINILHKLTITFSGLQSINISHRDIKPQNILYFKESNKYKLSDFGEAKELKLNNENNNNENNNNLESNYSKQTLRGTQLFMSPILFEALKIRKKRYIRFVNHNTFKSDVYSFGLMAFYAASLGYEALVEIRELKDNPSVRVVLDKYLKDYYSDKFINLIAKMLDIEEKTRCDFIELEKILDKLEKEY